MTTLVTGSEGFIGKHVVRTLKAGHETVIELDIRAEYDTPSFRYGDIRSENLLNDVFQYLRPDTVIHLAARVGVRESVTDPAGYVDTNVRGSLNVLEACRLAGVKQVVMASTSSVYGYRPRPGAYDGLRETDLPLPLSPYAASKVGMEALAQTYAHLYGLNIAVLRLFSVYGEGIRPDLMIYRLMDALRTGAPITRFCDADGFSLKRDWTYIGDVVNGILSAMHMQGFEIINVGRGRFYGLDDAIRILEDISERTVYTESIPAPLTEPLITWANISKAQRMLNYNPSVDIEEGLRRTWAWYQQSVIREPA